MLPIHVAVIIAMPTAPAAAVPAAMFRAMIPRPVAMIFAVLTPARIGGVQILVILSYIAMISPMAAAGSSAAVRCRLGIGMWVRMLRPSLDLLGALGTPDLHLCSPLGAPFGTIALAIRVSSTAPVAIIMVAILVLGDGRHRHRTGEEKGNYDFMHLDTPAETSPPMSWFSAQDHERTLNESRCFC
jgi:hypothetical protein